MKNTLFIGKKIIEFFSIDSTNNYLSKLAKETNVMDGTVILAQKQTEGKGQRGNSWVSEEGENLIFSAYLNFKFISIEKNFLISMMVSCALQELIATYCKDVFIKWPNDIYVNNKKIAGVLIENSIHKSSINHSIIGIGLNVNQLDFPADINATSLVIENNNDFVLSEINNNLCSLLEKYYFLLKNREEDTLRSIYFKNLLGYKTNRMYIINGNEISAKISNVKDNGFLQVEIKGKNQLFDRKEIKFIF